MNARIEAIVNMTPAERLQLLTWLALNHPGPFEAGLARRGRTVQDVPAFWHIHGMEGGTGEGCATDPGARATSPCQGRAT